MRHVKGLTLGRRKSWVVQAVSPNSMPHFHFTLEGLVIATKEHLRSVEQNETYRYEGVKNSWNIKNRSLIKELVDSEAAKHSKEYAELSGWSS